MPSRRAFLGSAMAALAASRAAAQQAAHLWEGYDFGNAANPPDRLDQGPFTIDQDAGWRTLTTTTASTEHIRNYGLGLVGYTWEENGPAVPVRRKLQTLEAAVEQMASLPFVDILYIRCDWRNVQSAPGRLDLHPVWELTADAAKRHGLRFGFRVQLSNPEFEPGEIALPSFLRDKIPLVKIGKLPRHGRDVEFVEPRYDHPEFQRAFRELNELLADRFDGDPLVEWMDMMMYGFWGEGHTSNLPNPFPNYLTASRTFREMTRLQLDAWKRVPLAVNTEPDISGTGNNEVLDMAVRAGCWLRSDSIIDEEPMQIEELANRPARLPAILEDGNLREYDIRKIPADSAGVNQRENAMLHVLDLGANYWSLWTEAANLEEYSARYPEGFRALQRRMGYRVRPAWVWQRKRLGAHEVIIGVANEGVAGIPGTLRLTVEMPERNLRLSGVLDAGHPHGAKMREAAFLLPPEIDGGILRLRADLETKGGIRRPVRWACAKSLNADGSFSIDLKKANAEGWLKGV